MTSLSPVNIGMGPFLVFSFNSSERTSIATSRDRRLTMSDRGSSSRHYDDRDRDRDRYRSSGRGDVPPPRSDRDRYHDARGESSRRREHDDRGERYARDRREGSREYERRDRHRTRSRSRSPGRRDGGRFREERDHDRPLRGESTCRLDSRNNNSWQTLTMFTPSTPTPRCASTPSG